MKMTFDEYIQNPMGKENAVISNRTMYRNLYTEKLDKILVREAGKIDYEAYHVGKKYICYLKIPSEVVPNFYYDVLVEFSAPKDKAIALGANLKDYTVRFYSNDPSFVYTFAHAFIKNDMFITDFENKMSKKAIKNRAIEKNPHNQVGYVKSLYFAYLIMSRRGLFSKTRYVDKYSKSKLDREIMHADKKIEAREEEAKKLSANKRKEKEKIKRITSPSNTQNPDIPIQPKSNPMKIGKVGTIGKNKSIGKIKGVKNIKKR